MECGSRFYCRVVVLATRAIVNCPLLFRIEERVNLLVSVGAPVSTGQNSVTGLVLVGAPLRAIPVSSFRDQDFGGGGRGTPHQFGGISIETNNKKIKDTISTTMCLSPSSPSLVSEIDLFAPSGSVFCCNSLSCLSKEDSNTQRQLSSKELEIVPWLSIRNRRSSVTKNNNKKKKSTRTMACFLIHMSFVERRSSSSIDRLLVDQ